jgi:hypothetical protein
MAKLVVPRDILAQHTIILGKTRSGKSTVMRGLVEDLLDRNQPVCIVDPKGDWWGLKLAADGKSPGYPVVIFGGEHADVPIDEHSGKHVAELFATGNRPCLIDLGGWMVGPRTRFWIEFASTLFKLTKGSRYLAIDEIHNFAPKGKIYDAEAGKALHWTNRLASEGLGKGVQIIGASQRPQKVHNDTLTSCETLIAMRVIHPSDRGAVADWIKGSADADGSEVLNSLADMARGEGWVWSPEIGFGPKRVQFPMFATYDSFRPQSVADTKKLTGWAEVDLDEVRAKLAAVVQEAKLNDPRELRLQLAAARAELSKLQVHAAHLELGVGVKGGADVAPLEKRIAQQDEALKKLRATKIEMAERVFTALHAHAQAQADRWAAQETKAREWLDRLTQIARQPIAPAAPRREPLTPPKAVGGTPVRPPGRPARDAAGNGHVGGAQQRILDGLAMLRSLRVHEAPRVLVATFANYGHTNSKGFTNALGTLSSAGYITYPRPGAVALTDAGTALAVGTAAPRTVDEAQDRIIEVLGGATERILRPLIAAYPHSLTRDDVATAAGYGHTNSKGFTNAIGRLRSLGFIEYPSSGQIVGTKLLFLED